MKNELEKEEVGEKLEATVIETSREMGVGRGK
jgi:hypothetical protein